MNLGAYTFRRIARESLRGRWLKAIVAGIIAVWLGAYAMTIPALCEYVAVISVLMLILEFIPGYYYVPVRPAAPARPFSGATRCTPAA